jgi:hypothetical protein
MTILLTCETIGHKDVPASFWTVLILADIEMLIEMAEKIGEESEKSMCLLHFCKRSFYP